MKMEVMGRCLDLIGPENEQGNNNPRSIELTIEGTVQESDRYGTESRS